MFTQIITKDGKNIKSRLISGTYFQILMGRSVMNEYTILKDGNYYEVNFTNDRHQKVKHQFIYEGFDYQKIKELETKEHEEELW